MTQLYFHLIAQCFQNRPILTGHVYIHTIVSLPHLHLLELPIHMKLQPRITLSLLTKPKSTHDSAGIDAIILSLLWHHDWCCYMTAAAIEVTHSDA